MERRVFLDASFWIALRDERDVNHARSRATLAALLKERALLITTVLVFAETQATFARARARSLQVINDYQGNPLIQSERTTAEDDTRALNLIRLHSDKSYSFCDALSFIVMERVGIKRALSFDDHFRQYGKFEVVD